MSEKIITIGDVMTFNELLTTLIENRWEFKLLNGINNNLPYEFANKYDSKDLYIIMLETSDEEYVVFEDVQDSINKVANLFKR